MARLAGIDLPREKRIEIALQYIFGVGPANATRMLAHTGINPDTRVKDLTEDDEKKLRDALDTLQIRVEGDLRREVQGNIKRLMDIGCYRGLRHRKGLPVRGQRTKTNARTRKGSQTDRRGQEEGRNQEVTQRARQHAGPLFVGMGFVGMGAPRGTNKLYAVITAGGPIDGAYAARAGTTLKALAPMRGRTMLARTIDALRGCGIEQIAVVGNDAVRDACAAIATVKMVADAGTGAGNVLGALDAWPDDATLLYLTCDMPYIDAASLQWVLDRIEPSTLSMPLAEHPEVPAALSRCAAVRHHARRRACRQCRRVSYSRGCSCAHPRLGYDDVRGAQGTLEDGLGCRTDDAGAIRTWPRLDRGARNTRTQAARDAGCGITKCAARARL